MYLLPVLFTKYGVGNIKTLCKGSQYMTIKTPRFQFLDQMNFLSHKKSYSAFIKEELSEELKGHLPYEYIRNLAVLQEPALPSYEHWFSQLRNENTLNTDYAAYSQYLRDGVSKEVALQNLGLFQAPIPGPEKLIELQRVFREKGFTKFRDWVEYYFRYGVW